MTTNSDVERNEPAATPENVNNYPSGLAVIDPDDSFENPGFPPHHERKTDVSPAAERRSARVVVAWLGLSALGAIFAIVAYVAFPISADDISTVRPNNTLVGLGIAVSLLGIGIAAIHWARQLMEGREIVEERHTVRGTPEERQRAAEIFVEADEESGFGRRSLIRRSLIGAALLAPLPGVVLLRDMAPYATQGNYPPAQFKQTLWKEGTRLARDPDGTPIKASDVTIGSAFHVIPEGLTNETPNFLNEKAKAVVLMVRLDPRELVEADDRKSWSYHGIVAYSKICTHVGCPVALVEQHTHHLLCPCHQSTFDVADGAKVIFGPAKRPLPQLPITVDSEGYLIAQSDFHEAVGPSFPEREL